VSQKGESNIELGKKIALRVTYYCNTQKYVWCSAERGEVGLACSVREKE
jgi:hypothetical protein